MKRDYHTYMVMGDGEMAEGTNYEGMMAAAYYKLDDINKKSIILICSCGRELFVYRQCPQVLLLFVCQLFYCYTVRFTI